MVEQVQLEVVTGQERWRSATGRYAALECQYRVAKRHRARVLAWGMGASSVRFVIDGERSRQRAFERAWKAGTCRMAVGGDLVSFEWAASLRAWLPDGQPDVLSRAVAWAHRAPIEIGDPRPLASPWSSHRDLLGFRRADFFDPRLLRTRVEGPTIHRLSGGGVLPERHVRSRRAREPLAFLLRIAAAIRGVLPADRRSFRLFVHLATARGWATTDLADALAVTGRRIRQLASETERDLRLALITLGSPDLCAVP